MHVSRPVRTDRWSSRSSAHRTRSYAEGLVTADGRLTVKRFRPAFADDVWAVHEAAMRASPLPFVDDAPADQPLLDVEAHYLDGNGDFLVGFVENELTTIGGFRCKDEDTVEIGHLRVHPDHQRRGFGERLLAELEGRARSDGATVVTLTTNARLTAARRLYEKAGYEESRREEHEETGFVFVRYRKRLADRFPAGN